jgi:hypothetical protein
VYIYIYIYIIDIKIHELRGLISRVLFLKLLRFCFEKNSRELLRV